MDSTVRYSKDFLRNRYWPLNGPVAKEIELTARIEVNNFVAYGSRKNC
jgi:hypothetical protein